VNHAHHGAAWSGAPAPTTSAVAIVAAAVNVRMAILLERNGVVSVYPGASVRSMALVAEFAGLLERGDLVEDGGEHAQSRRAQDAQAIGDLAEPQQPIVIGILVVFRRIESIDLMGDCQCFGVHLTHG